jgi:hypothetical protein
MVLVGHGLWVGFATIGVEIFAPLIPACDRT